MAPLSLELAAKRDRLIDALARLGRCAVAFSGGVDSAVVAKAAQLALGDAAVLVTGSSAALADGELESAHELSQSIGVRHVVVSTNEFANPSYVANGPDRCYHCKSELYGQLDGVSQQLGGATVVNGANADDLKDYRPGTRAAVEHTVRSPLAELGITKSEVRQLATHWDLPVADKPATPCLSSRVAYGLEVTSERLQRIDRAEQFLRSLGFRELRVRCHTDELARIEVPESELPELCQPEIRATVLAELRAIGFKFVTLDLAGLHSGSFTSLVPLEMLKRFS